MVMVVVVVWYLWWLFHSGGGSGNTGFGLVFMSVVVRVGYCW